jgi:hypothetical protein
VHWCTSRIVHTAMAVRLPHRRLASLLEFASKALLATAAPATPAPMAAAALHGKHALLHVRRFTALPAEQQPAGRRWDGTAVQQAAAGGRSQPGPAEGSAAASGSAGTAANLQTPRQQQARHAVRRPASHATQRGQTPVAPWKLQRPQPSGLTNDGPLASQERRRVQRPLQRARKAVPAVLPQPAARQQLQEHARNLQARSASRGASGPRASQRRVSVAAGALPHAVSAQALSFGANGVNAWCPAHFDACFTRWCDLIVIVETGARVCRPGPGKAPQTGRQPGTRCTVPCTACLLGKQTTTTRILH